MTGKITLDKVGHAASIVALPIGVCSFLYPGLEPYRARFFIVAVLAGLWIFYSLWKRIRAANELRDRRTEAPMVLLIGGAEFSDGMRAIENDARLLQEPYIRFKEVIVDGKDHWKELGEAVKAADAVILMPDFTGRSHPEVYEALVALCEELSVTISRYYPRDYELERARDFPISPFDSTKGIVEYSSEFLLKRAVDRGRFLQARIRLTSGIAVGTSVCFLTSIVFGLFGRQDLALLRKTLLVPSTVGQQVAAALADFRSNAGKGGMTEQEKISTKRLLDEWTKIEAQEINRISGNSEPITLQLFALSQDGQSLLPIAEHGIRGDQLSATESIAGCALQRKLAVYWRGRADETYEINAWNLQGTQVGEFDKLTKKLEFSSGSCEFQNLHRGDAKQQLLCMPIADDDSTTASKLLGVACISIDDPKDFMTSEWLRNYLSRELFAIGVFDPKRLLLPGVDPHSSHGGSR